MNLPTNRSRLRMRESLRDVVVDVAGADLSEREWSGAASVSTGKRLKGGPVDEKLC